MFRVTISPENFGLKRLKQNWGIFNRTSFLSVKLKFRLEFVVGWVRFWVSRRVRF